MNYRYSIIILNYLKYEDTINLLMRLNTEVYNSVLVIVVDNNSPNNSYNLIKKAMDVVKLEYSLVLLKHDKNDGYSAGNNIGLRYAYSLGCKASIVMNNDIYIDDEQDLHSLINSINELNVLVSPCIIENNVVVSPFMVKRPSNLQLIMRNLFFPLSVVRRKKRILLKTYVYAVSGSIFAVNMNFIHDNGFLDENVFLFGEELILSEQIFRKRLKVLYDPSVSVTHFHSKTINDVYKYKQRYIIFKKSLLYYYFNYRSNKYISFGIFKFSLNVRYIWSQIINKIKNDRKKI